MSSKYKIKEKYPTYETGIDIAAIRQTLKDIYGPVGIHWEVTEEKGYSYNGAKFFEGKSGLLSSYTPEMRAMNADFCNTHSIDPQTNYVFVLKYSGGTMKRDAAGFMPRGGQFGYIFTKDFQSDNEILQTIAHELGHGKLLLKHTFDKDYGIAQGTTDNLMDYAQSKTHLAKWQWDVLADPGIAQGVFDRDEDGMSIIKENVRQVLKYLELIRKHSINGGSFEVTDIGYYTSKNIRLSDDNVYEEIKVQLILQGDAKQGKNEEDTYAVETSQGFWKFKFYNNNFRSIVEVSVKKKDNNDILLREYLFIKDKNVYREQLDWTLKQPMKDKLMRLSVYPESIFGELSDNELISLLNDISINNEYFYLASILIRNRNMNNIQSFFEELDKTNIVHKLKSNMSFSLYKDFIKSLLTLYYKQDGLIEKFKNISHDKLFIWYEGIEANGIGDQINYNINFIETTIKIKSSVEKWVGIGAPGMQRPSYAGTVELNPEPLSFSPSTLIGIEIRTPLGNIASTNGKMLPIPAFYFDWLLMNKQREDYINLIDIGVNILSIALGITELRAVMYAGNFLFVAKHIGAIVIPSVNIVLLSKNIQSKLKESEFLTIWNSFCLIYDIVTFDLQNIQYNKAFFDILLNTWNLEKNVLNEQLDTTTYEELNILMNEIVQYNK